MGSWSSGRHGMRWWPPLLAAAAAAAAALLLQPASSTTIVAAKFNGGVVVGADSRTSSGTYVSNRYADKIEEVYEGILLCRSGSAADTQHLADALRARLEAYALTQGRPPSTRSAAHLARALLRGSSRGALAADIIIAGAADGGLFSIPRGGALLEHRGGGSSTPGGGAAGSGSGSGAAIVTHANVSSGGCTSAHGGAGSSGGASGGGSDDTRGSSGGGADALRSDSGGSAAHDSGDVCGDASAAAGSGAQVALGYLDAHHDARAMGADACADCVLRALRLAAARDAGSGGALVVCVLTREGGVRRCVVAPADAGGGGGGEVRWRVGSGSGGERR